MNTPAKHSNTLKLVMGTFLFLLCASISHSLFANGYDAFVSKYFYFIGNVRHSGMFTGDNRPLMLILFYIIKGLSVLLCGLILYRMYKVSKGSSYLFFKREPNISSILNANVGYIRTLPKPILMLLMLVIIAQAAFSIYFMSTEPFFYDEAWSYMYFSGRGTMAALCYYPAPNNHVFFNVVGSFVDIPGPDAIYTLRIPSVIFGILSVYYFFKLSYKMFSPAVAGITTILFTFSFPQVYFSNMGRGYGMLIFFAVLLIYSAACLLQDPQSRKYLSLYVIASVFGLFTIPSFLYCYVPVASILFVEFLQKDRKLLRHFIIASFIAGGGTLLMYGLIIHFNGINAITSNNGVIHRDMAYIREHIQEHLLSTWRFLTGYEKASLISFCLLLGYLVIRVIVIKSSRPMILLLITFYISPIVFIMLQKVIPFERTWSHLIVPIVLGVGFLLNDIFGLIARLVKLRLSAAVALTVPAMIAIAYVSIRNFEQQRPVMHMNDHWAQQYLALIGDKISRIKVIGYADEDLNFYLAEDIQFEVIRKTRKFEATLSIVGPENTTQQDIIVLKKGGAKTASTLAGYDQLSVDEPLWDVYIKKGL